MLPRPWRSNGVACSSRMLPRNWSSKHRRGNRTFPRRCASPATNLSFLPRNSWPLDRSFTSSVSNAVSSSRLHSIECTVFLSASCKTMLNPGNINVHETKIYCVPCHRRQFGPRGLGRGLANCFVEAIETPPSSPSLSRDEPDTYDHLNHPVNHRHDEKNAAQSSPPSRASSEDSGVFLGALKSRQVVSNSSPSRPVTSSLPNAAAFRMVSAPASVCPRCSKTVYSAEEIKAVGKSFHKRCYTCAKCKGSISAGRYSEHEGELYDNSKRRMKQ